ncbi:PIN domain-containing protein [Chryseobacterium sp.]|uniref:PIN domain-containing protein n=1 Tax=Chryseobacterium sp. TaxID=1871047 RepID=UPI00333FC2BA
MIEKFGHYLPLGEKEFSELFKSAYFVLDTNVLINFYRYSQNTTNQFFDILEKIKDRIYLPYQIANEFFTNRLNEISVQKNSYKEMVEKLTLIKQDFENKNRNPFLSAENLALFDIIINELKEKEDEYGNLKREDKILSKINSIFKNGGDEFYEYDKIVAEGKKRYKDKIPPGYKDDDKPIEIQKYGDYIIWIDLLKKSKTENKPCIFITDDNKEDWWLLDKNKNIISPRPELRKEFLKETGQIYYSYQPFNFLNTIQKYIDVKIEESVINEVKNNSLEKLQSSSVFIDKYVVAENDSDFIQFAQRITDVGYNIDISFLNRGSKGFFYKITAMLPEIFDVERRYIDYFRFFADQHSVKILNNEEIENLLIGGV